VRHRAALFVRGNRRAAGGARLRARRGCAADAGHRSRRAGAGRMDAGRDAAGLHLQSGGFLARALGQSRGRAGGIAARRRGARRRAARRRGAARGPAGNLGGVRAAYEEIWRDGAEVDRMDHYQLDIHAAPAIAFATQNELSRHFADGYRFLAPYLVGGAVWFVWNYKRPGDTLGIEYDGLVRLG